MTVKDDSPIQTFSIGGKPTELKFTAAVRFRLFADIDNSQIESYITSDGFKIKAVGCLLFGKEIKNMTGEDLLDKLDVIGLMDDELEAIVGWVRTRTLNFMLDELKNVKATLETVIPKAQVLQSSLTGSET